MNRRLVYALIDLGVFSAAMWAQSHPEDLSKAAVLRHSAGLSGRVSRLLFRGANKVSGWSLALETAYRREVA